MTYILVWTDRVEGQFIDHWAAYETLEQAQQDYAALSGFDDTWSISLCKPILSTDFEVTK